MGKHTPGPWRWEFNESHRSLHLVGGRPMYDLTVVDFKRWGMCGATMRLRDTSHDGMNLMFRVHERADWIAPEPGRVHHKSWHQLLTHPDARLIAAAPDLLEACMAAIECGMVPVMSAAEGGAAKYSRHVEVADMIRAAIAKATGEQP